VHDLYTKFTDHRRVEKVKCLKLMDINLPVGNQEKFEGIITNSLTHHHHHE
jgi:hypothetical protein